MQILQIGPGRAVEAAVPERKRASARAELLHPMEI